MKSSVNISIIRRMLALTVLALGCVWASVSLGAEKVYYRYVNDEGVKVLNATVPPALAKNGYEVVTISGKVLEVVPPAPSDEEKEAAAERRRREARLAEWDETLLRRYSEVSEIETAKERKIADYDAAASILRGNVNNLASQIADAQARAADLERAGRAIPQAILNNIKSLRKKLEDTEAQIKMREQEKQEMANQYDMDIERFREIKPKS